MKKAIDFLISKEPHFKTIVETYGDPTIPSRPEGFQTLVLLILEQQVSLDSAKAAFKKLQSKVNSIDPENLALLSDEEYRSAGVSRQKTSYIKGLSNSILMNEIDLESLKHKSSEVVRQELIKLKGIGNWTIDVYLMFSLSAADILPIGDIGVTHTMKELWGFETKDEMLKHSENWAPYRSFATYLLWHHYLRKRNRTFVY